MGATDHKPASRSGGRNARRALRTAPKFDMLPGLVGKLPLCEVMDGAQVERIDAAILTTLHPPRGALASIMADQTITNLFEV